MATQTAGNPQHPLSVDEIKLVRDSWEVVKKDLTTVGFELFDKFFRAHPDYQKLFKGFANVPLDELRGNKRVEAHAKAVLYAITQLVDNLDDVELIIEMLKKQGRNHKNRKVDSVKFQNLGTVLVGYLSEKLGSQVMTENAVQAWTKTYSIIVKVVHDTQNNPDDED